MKRIINLSLSILFITFASLSAYDGERDIPIEQVPESVNSSITYFGPVAKAGYYAENLTVYGPLALTDSVIDGSLTVHGPCVLENSVVKGSAIFFGAISINNSTLHDLQVTATKIELVNSTVQDIVILKNENEPQEVCHPCFDCVLIENGNEPQELSLQGNTKVTGVITFEQDNGVVKVSPEASYPSVINGGVIVFEFASKIFHNNS
ncbi:MAG: hypothetical protein ACHQUC_03815 [Chlamydiales bacterium]